MNNIFIYFSWLFLLLLLFYMYSTVSFLSSIRSARECEREKREDIYIERELAHESSNNITMKFLIYESTRRVKLLE